MRPKPATTLLALALALAAAGATLAQEPARPSPPKSQSGRAAQKNNSAADQTDAAQAVETSDEAMRRVLTNLSNQVNLLTSEVRKLRQETSRNSDTMQLLLYEERLARVEEKIEAAMDHKMELDARETDIQRRMRNIQQELILRGGLRRDEAEAALRADLQRALDDVKSQQLVYQQRISELTAQATRLRARVEALRKKVERADERDEKQEPDK